ncbi:MAG: acyltransferase [Bacteroidetes bacterium 4572_77]|nr:MAG: acyltransferase [Bacteroidetes bacterium 4572_77]
MSITAKISTGILRLFGWKAKGPRPIEKKFVFLAAPHTSNWDFPLGRLTNSALEIELKVLMKKSWFIFPLGSLLRALGAIPIDRSKSGTVIDHIVSHFNEKDEFVFAITPEGTRSYVESWKTGFYTIAQKANVPIVCGYMDYEKKETGVGPTIYPSGDMEKDFEKIIGFYRTVNACYPENFNPNPQLGKSKRENK